MRIPVRVRPGARRNAVGGRWDGPGGVGPMGPALMVTVSAPAVAGKANAAVCAVLAGALGLRVRDVTVVAGLHSRDKVVDLAIRDGAGAGMAERIAALLGR